MLWVVNTEKEFTDVDVLGLCQVQALVGPDRDTGVQKMQEKLGVTEILFCIQPFLNVMLLLILEIKRNSFRTFQNLKFRQPV